MCSKSDNYYSHVVSREFKKEGSGVVAPDLKEIRQQQQK